MIGEGDRQRVWDDIQNEAIAYCLDRVEADKKAEKAKAYKKIVDYRFDKLTKLMSLYGLVKLPLPDLSVVELATTGGKKKPTFDDCTKTIVQLMKEGVDFRAVPVDMFSAWLTEKVEEHKNTPRTTTVYKNNEKPSGVDLTRALRRVTEYAEQHRNGQEQERMDVQASTSSSLT